MFLQILWYCSQSTSYNRNKLCLDISQFLYFYLDVLLFIYHFLFLEDNVLISWYWNIYNQAAFFPLSRHLFQSLYVYWYWSLIEVYIYHFPVQFLVYKHILETILENDKCKRIWDFNISTRKVHKTLHWLPRERYNFQCNAYQLILQWKLYLLHGNQ